MAQKVREPIGIEEAVNNLEAIAAIDLDAPGPIGIVPKNRIVTDPEEFPSGNVRWLESEGAEVLLDILDATFRSIYDYLVRLAGEKATEHEISVLMHLPEEPHLEEVIPSERVYKGVSMLMALVGDAAHRMDRYLEIRMGRKMGKIEERPEFQTLRDFFQRNFSSEFHKNEPHNPNAFVIRDMDQVRLDKEYELFYIRNEEGMLFYDLEIIRNMRIICDFDSEGGEFEEDPLLKVRAMLDRDAAASAGQILGDCHRVMKEFYIIHRKMDKNNLADHLNHSCLALFLCHNPRNLLQNTNGKTSLQYFEDFHRFLRAALKTSEYQKLIAYPPEKSDRITYALLNLAHSLSKSLFHRAGGVKEEAIGLIHRVTRKGKPSKSKPHSLWNHFLLEDESYRELLSKFPSGPLLKILDLLRSEEEESAPFDPIDQGNYPLSLFNAKWGNIAFDILHLPCPTTQAVINQAKIVEEFCGFLRHYNAVSPTEKHLLFNLQDPSSWKEMARSNALIALQKSAEFSKTLAVATLPKSGDFYYQRDVKPDDFLPTLLQTQAPFKVEPIVSFVHEHFFANKKDLTERERQDFIEIFHLFLILKMIDHYKPHSISFTCKDGVDTGAAQTAAFYAFLKLLNGDFTRQEDHDYFRWLLNAPALFVRERPLDNERLNRTLAALECLDRALLANSDAILNDMGKFYKNSVKSVIIN